MLMKHSATRYARASTYPSINTFIMMRARLFKCNSKRYPNILSSFSLVGPLSYETHLLKLYRLIMTGSVPITTQAEIRHSSCSWEESKCANQAKAWSPPYTNAAALRLRPRERLVESSSTWGQFRHRGTKDSWNVELV